MTLVRARIANLSLRHPCGCVCCEERVEAKGGLSVIVLLNAFYLGEGEGQEGLIE